MDLLTKVLQGYVLNMVEIKEISDEIDEIDKWLDMELEQSMIDNSRERLTYLIKVLKISEKNLLKGKKVVKMKQPIQAKGAEIIDMFTVFNNAKNLQDLTAKYQREGDDKYFDKKVAHLNIVMEQLEQYHSRKNKTGAA